MKKKSWIFPTILALIATMIMWLNHQPGNWLTGWDTLHPEFDLSLNLERVINGVWREDQGLGTLAKHAHMSELPRILSLILLDIALPTNAIRYVFIAICFVLGPLGVYFFIQEILGKKNVSGQLSAFVGGLFYIFNLGTAQHFSVVFEMFAVQYAALGWLFYSAYRSWKDPTKRNLLWLLTISFLAAPMAYASQLWFAFAINLGMFLLVLSLFSRNLKKKIKNSLLIGAVLFTSNAFWLLPNLNFLLGDGAQIPANSHIHRIFSPESFYQNASFGTAQDTLIFKNFLFNWQSYDHSTNSFQPLLTTWSQHLDKQSITFISYAFAGFILAGLSLAIINKHKSLLALIPVHLVSFLVIANQLPIFKKVFEFLRENSGLINEGLRTPYTKFSILLMMTSAIFLAYFVQFVLIQFKNKSNFLQYTLASLFSICLIYFGWPMFQGKLIHPLLQQKIPQEYFELFEYMQAQPHQARLAVLPAQTLYGWEYYDWGYEGAGFLWFGLPQSVLVRDFDRWNPDNESFYNQLSQSIYSNNHHSFEKTFEKYDVSFVLLDKHIIAPNQPAEILKISQIQEMLATSQAELIWQNNGLELYQISTINDSYLNAVNQMQLVKTAPDYLIQDLVFETGGDFLTIQSGINYPFAQLLVNQFTNQNVGTLFKKILSAELVLPPLTSNKYYPVTLHVQLVSQQLIINFEPLFTFDVDGQETAFFKLPKTTIELPNSYPEYLVQIQDQEIKIAQGQTLTKTISLKADQAIPIIVFDPQNIQLAEGQRLVDISQVNSAIIPTKVWELIKPANLNLLVKQAISYSPLLINQIDLTQQDDNNYNCQTEQQGRVKTSMENNTVTYFAENGAINCQSINLADMSPGWKLLRVKGNNLTGKSLKVVIENLSSHQNQVEDLLPSGEFDQVFPFLVTPESIKNGHYLSLQTQSYGRISSVNQISIVEIYAAPLEYLTQIKTIDLDKIENQFSLDENHRINNYLYRANTSGTGIISLSQGFDTGWIAIIKSKNESWLKSKKLTHLEHNGWANAWEVLENEAEILIIYLPQSLQFFGYALLTLVGIYLITSKNQ